jgi:glucose/arabinose dehydrogenase
MARRGFACALLAAMALAAAAPAALAAPHPGYRVPLGNPFVTTPGALAEIYVRGMRNPYRWSFDAPTGDMYVADVGGDQREEVTYLPKAKIAGANLGWHCLEGTAKQKGCRVSNYFPPAFEYASSPDVVIGGYVVHDPGMPSFIGRYLYGRYASGVWVLGPNATGPTLNLRAVPGAVTGFGQDGAGRLYVTTLDGPAYRLSEVAGAVTLTLIGTFDEPTEIRSPPSDATRLFVVERAGRVQLLEGGVATTFLDIRDRVSDAGYEEGLVGFAPAPDYNSSGRVFVFYSDNAGDIQVDEYRRTAQDPDRADPSTRRPVLTIQHDQGADPGHHYGGQLNFGSDGYLYISTGDGDLEVDPQNDSQRLDSLLGKILRIDVRDGPPDTAVPRLRVTVAEQQRVLHAKSVVAFMSCNERCAMSASARMRIGSRSYTLRPAAVVPRAHRKGRLKLELTRDSVRTLKRALKKKRKVAVKITLHAADSTGNSPKAVTRTVRVTG